MTLKNSSFLYKSKMAGVFGQKHPIDNPKKHPKTSGGQHEPKFCHFHHKILLDK